MMTLNKTVSVQRHVRSKRRSITDMPSDPHNDIEMTTLRKQSDEKKEEKKKSAPNYFFSGIQNAIQYGYGHMSSGVARVQESVSAYFWPHEKKD